MSQTNLPLPNLLHTFLAVMSSSRANNVTHSVRPFACLCLKPFKYYFKSIMKYCNTIQQCLKQRKTTKYHVQSLTVKSMRPCAFVQTCNIHRQKAKSHSTIHWSFQGHKHLVRVKLGYTPNFNFLVEMRCLAEAGICIAASHLRQR